MDDAPEWIRPGDHPCAVVRTGGITVLPGMELMGCPDMAVPADVMHHVVRVESSFNPYAIGVVGGRLARQPANLAEAVATARMLESRGYNFSLGLAQVNRYNLGKYGLASYGQAFQACPNLQAGSRILAECRQRSGGDWGKAFSCYYSGNFVTGFRAGYVQKIYASMRRDEPSAFPDAIAVYRVPNARATAASTRVAHSVAADRMQRRIATMPVPAAEPPDAASQPITAPPTDAGVAVLRLGGQSPRIVAAAGATSPPSSTSTPPMPRRDTAFVF
jgi:type IV secretion system protein VirB1